MATARVTLEARTSGEIRLRLRANEGAAADNAPPLSTIAMNFKTKRWNCLQSGYGALPSEPRKYTSYARRITREAAGALEEEYGENCWFCTFTLPGSTAASIATLAQWSSYVMARVRQWFRDNAPGSEIIAVWELQRRGALHLHLACGGVPEGLGSALKSRLHGLWCALLEQLSATTGVDLFGRAGGGTWRNATDAVQVDAQPVKKSIARYLAKYISKQKVSIWTKEHLSPTRWWSCSRSLLHKVLSRRVTHVGKTLDYNEAQAQFETLAGTISGACSAVFTVTNEYRPGDRCLSLWAISPEVARSLAVKAMLTLPEAQDACYNLVAEKRTPLGEASQLIEGLPLCSRYFSGKLITQNSPRYG